jgi:hypothetical protein
MHFAALARIELATALRAAVAGAQLQLHDQPIVQCPYRSDRRG